MTDDNFTFIIVVSGILIILSICFCVAYYSGYFDDTIGPYAPSSYGQYIIRKRRDNNRYQIVARHLIEDRGSGNQTGYSWSSESITSLTQNFRSERLDKQGYCVMSKFVPRSKDCQDCQYCSTGPYIAEEDASTFATVCEAERFLEKKYKHDKVYAVNESTLFLSVYYA